MADDSLIIIVDEKELVVEILSDPVAPRSTVGPAEEPNIPISKEYILSTPHKFISGINFNSQFASSSPNIVDEPAELEGHRIPNDMDQRPSGDVNIGSSPRLFVDTTVSSIFNDDEITQTRLDQTQDKINETPTPTPLSTKPTHDIPRPKARFNVDTPSKSKLLDFNSWFSSEASDPISEASSSPFKAPTKRPKIDTNKKTSRVKTSSKIKGISKTDSFTTKEINQANRVNRLKDELIAELEVELSPELAVLCGSKLKSRVVSRDFPVLTWIRKVTASYDPENGVFMPCQPREERENIFLVYLQAKEFIDHITKSTFVEFLQKCKECKSEAIMQASTAYEVQVLVMVEGYEKERTKLKAAHDREFQKEIRKALGECVRKNGNSNLLDVNQLESNINELQVLHGFNIFYTKGLEDSVNWTYSFTYSVSNSRYVKKSNINIGVKLGVDGMLAYLAALQQFRFITQARAELISTYFPTIQVLHETLEDKGTLGKADNNTSNIVPPSTDRVFKKFFLSEDPDEVLE